MDGQDGLRCRPVGPMQRQGPAEPLHFAAQHLAMSSKPGDVIVAQALNAAGREAWRRSRGRRAPSGRRREMSPRSGRRSSRDAHASRARPASATVATVSSAGPRKSPTSTASVSGASAIGCGRPPCGPLVGKHRLRRASRRWRGSPRAGPRRSARPALLRAREGRPARRSAPAPARSLAPAARSET